MLDTIQVSLRSFAEGNLTDNALAFFRTLGYASERQQPLAEKTYAEFAATFVRDEASFNQKNALVEQWRYVDFLFQLTESELGDQQVMFQRTGIDERITSYLFFAIELTGTAYSRTALSQITREVNKVFSIPVMALFKYGECLTLAVIERQPHQRDEAKDVLRKVTLIKDIRCAQPHRAHLEILADLALPKLSGKHSLSNFLELHQAWQKVLDTKELNKRFFKELANWYFWAVNNVTFPADEEKDATLRNATSVIRLITRLMFVWFLKEKGLVSDKLFEQNQLEDLLHFKDESTYYQAILQNLFFATLNSAMGERKFMAESVAGRNSQHFVHNVFRYRKAFQQPDATIAELFEPIPFLNGGLFECLDKETDAGRTRVDGFSDHAKNVLRVPDELFFGAERDIELNEVYGTKNKKYKVRGLLNILNSYKFTIAENTPIEEEIALDPELLGKVFENLLANYNPETRTTARKQTGSFYTPREIVNYMVDESLIAYLKTKLQTETEGWSGGFQAFNDTQPNFFGNEMRRQQAFEIPLSNNRWHGQDEALETALRALLSYQNPPHPFTANETEILIRAIDNCKILDPACGSGAFPMGILLKLVHLLEKLDPADEKWKEWQKLKAIAETKAAFEIGNQREREDRLKEISEIFEDNSSDYGRKLFLIENCIYGVDIQPIAIQIAKLRFFISLIVDQDFNDDPTRNRGIRPLPNLETKFVAANTLIGLEMTGLKPDGINQLEEQLKEIRAKHFGARTRKTKEKYREADKRLRGEIAALLTQAGFPATSANQISGWNPYDQNTKADWFDAEWMFGIEQGFDIVIGNPPYIFARDSKGKGFSAESKSYFYKNYQLAEYQVNLYPLFIENGTRQLRENGVLSYIVPNNWLTINTNKSLRKFILLKSDITIVNFYAIVFESAAVDSSIVIFTNSSERGELSLFEYVDDFSLIKKAPRDFFLKQKDFVINIESLKGSKTSALLQKIESDSDELSSVSIVKAALMAYEVGKGEPPQTKEMKDARVYHSRKKEDESYIKYLDGEDVSRYQLGWGGEYLKYGKNLAAPRTDFGLYSTERILVRQIPSKPPYCIHACLTTETILNDRNSMIVYKITESPEAVLAILNSRLTSFWFVHKFGKLQRETFPQFKVNELADFPLPKSRKNAQPTLAALANKILAAKKADAKADTKQWEAEIDALVYQLYGLSAAEIALVEGGNASTSHSPAAPPDKN